MTVYTNDSSWVDLRFLKGEGKKNLRNIRKFSKRGIGLKQNEQKLKKWK